MLSSIPAFAHQFDTPNDYGRGRVADGKMIFDRIVRPQRVQVRAIPPIELSYFDPESGQYATVKSESLPLTVSPARVFTAYDADFADGRALKNYLRASTAGIGHNYAGDELLHGQSAPSESALVTILLLLAAILPPLAFIILWLREQPAVRSWCDPAERRRRRALRDFERDFAVLKTGDVRALEFAVRAYMASRFGLLPKAHDMDEIASALGCKSDDPRLVSIAALYGSAGSAHYAQNVNHGDPKVHIAEAQAAFDAAMELAMKDQDAAERMYRDAAMRYEKAVDGGIRNAKLFNNLGNAWYFAGDRGRALLNYRRAERLEPNNALVLQNITFIRSELPDVVPPTLKSQALAGIRRASSVVPELLRLLLFIVANIAFWVLLKRKVVEHRRCAAGILAVLGAVSLLLLLSLAVDRLSVHRPGGVVVQSEVVPRKGNSYIYEAALTTALHSGAEFTVVERRGDWLHVRIDDRLPCWLPVDAVELVTE
jgi:tetratricopeptide (TPR) repeat protein